MVMITFQLLVAKDVLLINAQNISKPAQYGLHNIKLKMAKTLSNTSIANSQNIASNSIGVNSV